MLFALIEINAVSVSADTSGIPFFLKKKFSSFALEFSFYFYTPFII